MLLLATNTMTVFTILYRRRLLLVSGPRALVPAHQRGELAPPRRAMPRAGAGDHAEREGLRAGPAGGVLPPALPRGHFSYTITEICI